MKAFTYSSLLLASLVLAACGGGGSSGAASNTLSAASTSAADQTGAAATPVLAPAPSEPSAAASGWTSCGTEGQTCSFSGTRNVRFGANGTYAYKTATTSIRCSVSDFPDPLPGVAKSCDYTDSTTTTTTTTQVVEYYGDSTIWGYKSGVGGQVATPAPAAFAAALPAAGSYDVRNEGVSGTTACDLLNGTDGKHPAWTSQMAASKAKYVLVNFAINDEWKYDVNTYKSCLGSLASIAKQNGKQMIFETPNPTRDSGSTGLDVYVNAMKSVATAQSVPVIDQYQYLTNYLNGQSPYTICPDGLHPTDAVYILKGQYAADVFQSIAN